eukprot:TRINITY_DN8829_c0_g1_i1.p2 TRINITY_DN8829_c0_g1~~TRINITY_DN8829_c0_g1_i1.p2  ORF type:complete len:131 (+),score=25.04 TRINITY_DN8829_c0_g1_i1:1-393(+)
MGGFRFRAVAPATLLAVTMVAAAVAPSPAAAQTCAGPSDLGRFLGWCRCSALTVPRAHVAPPSGPADPRCAVTAPPTVVRYCDTAGPGNCDLQCVRPIHECTGPVGAGGACPCAVGGYRAMLHYNGPMEP